MATFTVAGRHVALDRESVERGLEGILPEPVREHYVVVGVRRYPPKQVIGVVTGLDRADFTTHQARRILMRLGFTASRVGAYAPPALDGPQERAGALPHGGRQAAALEPYRGLWVALGDPTEVIVAAETPQEVLSWLARHGRRAAGGLFRVPAPDETADGLAPA